MLCNKNHHENVSKKRCFAVLLLFIIAFVLGFVSKENEIKKNLIEEETQKINWKKHPLYCIHTPNNDPQRVQHVIKVVERLGYQQDCELRNWDILLAFGFYFSQLYPILSLTQKHQKINHIPGFVILARKVNLTRTNYRYIPKSFVVPDDTENLLEYSKNNPGKYFLQKNIQHRGVSIKNISDIDLNNTEIFVQEFIDRPLLVDGHKFDIGVYTIITSIDPLRIYIYNGDVLFRYCLAKYHPFDPSNIDKYVMQGDYIPTGKIPSLSKYFKAQGLGMRDSFTAYMISKGIDTSNIWMQINESIREMLLMKEGELKEYIDAIKPDSNFYEMVRFDFIVDENLRVFLLEMNAGPNLNSRKFKDNALLYEQLLYSTMGLVGVGQRSKKPSLDRCFPFDEFMQSAFRNVMVQEEYCIANNCKSRCNDSECSICRECLDNKMYIQIHNAYKEHINQIECERIFPPSMTGEHLSKEYLSQFSARNQIMISWFNAKCREDKRWCSDV